MLISVAVIAEKIRVVIVRLSKSVAAHFIIKSISIELDNVNTLAMHLNS